MELDGGQHAGYANVEYDGTRTGALEGLGIRVIRFWDHDVLQQTDAIADEIYRHLSITLEPSPQPSPGVPGEGE